MVHLLNTFRRNIVFLLNIYSFYVLVSGRPEEQDDSENSTIYITGLTEKANLEEMAEFFKHVGPIRVRIALHSTGLCTRD